jgi:hypothetical protein
LIDVSSVFSKFAKNKIKINAVNIPEYKKEYPIKFSKEYIKIMNNKK